MKIKKDYVKKVNFHFEQVCKRAENLINYYNGKYYNFSYGGKYHSVTIFGEASLLLGNKKDDESGVLLKLLEIDKISVEDYQLMSFYESCYSFARDLLDDLLDINKDVMEIYDDVFDALFAIESFEEGTLGFDKKYYLGSDSAK